MFGQPTPVEKGETQNSVLEKSKSESTQPKDSLVRINEFCENSEISKDDIQIPPMPSGQEEALPCLGEKFSDQNKKERHALRKTLHVGRTKEGLDNDRFEKRHGCIKKDWKKMSFSERRVIFRKRLGRFGSKAKGSRTLRKRFFKMILEAKQEERKGEKNLNEDTSQDNKPREKASPGKTAENNNSWGTNNTKKPKYRFTRKTGKTRQN